MFKLQKQVDESFSKMPVNSEVSAVSKNDKNSRGQSDDCYYGSDRHRQHQDRRDISNNRACHSRNGGTASLCTLRRRVVCNIMGARSYFKMLSPG